MAPMNGEKPSTRKVRNRQFNYSALLPVSEDSTILKPGPIVELKAIPRTYLPFDVKGLERKILLYNARIFSAN